MSKRSSDWLYSNRVVCFGDLDPAGVIHFYHIFRWAHEAWEESLMKFGISKSSIFPVNRYHDVSQFALPIIQSNANFFHPILLGDNIEIFIKPSLCDSNSFEITTEFRKGEKVAAFSSIKHIAIDPILRSRTDLPEDIKQWLNKSSFE